jgi:cytochrome c-type biogenesis protein CcmF
MGSLWAYVALSFGGYWAWDPVENASLVPWMTLVAGIHVHMVSRNTGFATRSVYFFYLITFILILYSTFLTRSGVLGDTSAHAFTEMGLEWQLIILLTSFVLLGFLPWILRFRQIPHPAKEEHIASREFWMYIGTMVIVFGAFLITASTSLPVYNKIMTWFNPAWEGRVIQNVIDHYNKYQLWIAVFVCLLSGLSLFLRYSAANWAGYRTTFLQRMAIHSVLAGILTGLTALWIDFVSWQFVILGFSGLFGMTTGLDYLMTKGMKDPSLAWSSLSHLGFGMMILGTITSGLNQSAISSNPFVFQGIFSEEDLKKYVQLIKGKPLLSQGHLITYQSDTLVGRERIYSIQFQKLKEDLQVEDEWTLHPTALYSNDYSKIAAFNPDTRHHIDRDIFTCVVGLPPSVESMEKAKKIEDTLRFRPIDISFNDTIDLGDYILKAGDVNFKPGNAEYLKNAHDAGLSVTLSLYDKKRDTTYQCQPALGIQGALLYNYPEGIEDAGMKFKILEDNVETFFTPEEQLDYQEFTLKDGESFKLGQTTVRLVGFNRSPVSPAYTPAQGDIAVGARLEVQNQGSVELAEPIYVIRDNQPMSIKSYTASSGLHVRFANIDPKSETFTFRVAADLSRPQKMTIGWATGVPRSDYVILQATIFPGINLFWAGSILMMAGLLGAASFRFLKRKA